MMWTRKVGVAGTLGVGMFALIGVSLSLTGPAAVAHAQDAQPVQVPAAGRAGRGAPPPPVQIEKTAGVTEEAPTFELDASWPKPLPNRWVFGTVWAVGVGPGDHIWVGHAVGDAQRLAIEKEGKVPAPAVVEFDPAGNVVRGFGGRDNGYPWVYDTPGSNIIREHALNVDDKGNVWMVGGGHLALKFSREGKFLLQLGVLGQTGDSNDTKLLGDPANVDFDYKANEVYVADGYKNRRIIVFDMNTGAYKRHWGRYGKPPDDSFEPHPQQAWFNPPGGPKGQFPRFAHGANLTRDGLVYAADRAHSAIQIFKYDGTFVREVQTPVPYNSVSFSPDQYYLYGNGINAVGTMVIHRRSDMAVLGSFKSVGQHYSDTDSKGNLYTCGTRMPQRFVLRSQPKRTGK